MQNTNLGHHKLLGSAPRYDHVKQRKSDLSTNSQIKQKYIAPIIDVLSIHMEESIATGSAKVYPGNNPDNSFTPQVEDWQDKGIGGAYYDF